MDGERECKFTQGVPLTLILSPYVGEGRVRVGYIQMINVEIVLLVKWYVLRPFNRS